MLKVNGFVMSLHCLRTCACARPLQSCPTLQPHGLQPTRLLGPWCFSSQEHWSEFPCPPPWDLPDSGIEPRSLTSPALAGQFFTTSATREALYMHISSVQWLSRVQLFATPWTAARQASLSIVLVVKPCSNSISFKFLSCIMILET